MSRSNAVNYTAAGSAFPKANADTDPFDSQDVQVLAEAVDVHDHSATRGLAVARIVDGIVSTAKLIDGAVTTAKIAALNVTTALINDLAVTTAKIADLNVTTAKLAAGSVTQAKLGTDVVVRNNLLTNGGFEFWERHASATLNGAHTLTDTTIIVNDTGAFPTTGHFRIDDEIIIYTGKTATTFTGCTRAQYGTVAVGHASGALVEQAMTATSAYGPDTWFLGLGGGGSAAVTADRTTFDVSGGAGTLAARFNAVMGGGGSVQLISSLDPDVRAAFSARPLSISARVRTSTAGVVTITAVDSLGNSTTSAAHTGDGTWQTLTATFTSGAAPTYIRVAVTITASAVVWLDNYMMVSGALPADYSPVHPSEDRVRCFRRYEVIRSLNVVGAAHAASMSLAVIYAYKARKISSPTVTKNGTWNVANCGQPIANTSGLDHALIYVNSSAAGSIQFYADTADDTITIEAN